MENLNSILKEIGEDKVKSITIKWEKVLNDKAFQNIKIKFYKEKKDGK